MNNLLTEATAETTATFVEKLNGNVGLILFIGLLAAALLVGYVFYKKKNKRR